jgi:hypothetical protein
VLVDALTGAAVRELAFTGEPGAWWEVAIPAQSPLLLLALRLDEVS